MKELRFPKLTRAEGRFIRQTSSRDSYGHVVLEVEPSISQDLAFSWEVQEADIPREFHLAVQDGVTGWLKEADLSCVSTIIRVVGGSYNVTDSSALSYTIAAGFAFEEAVKNGGTVCGT